jgi:hypothetical protein
MKGVPVLNYKTSKQQLLNCKFLLYTWIKVYKTIKNKSGITVQLTVIVSSEKEKTKHFTVAASQTTSYKWMAGKNGHHQLKVNKYISQHGFRANTLGLNVYDQRNGGKL